MEGQGELVKEVVSSEVRRKGGLVPYLEQNRHGGGKTSRGRVSEDSR